MNYYIAFDIGKNGGIAILDDRGNVVTKTMPKIADEIDLHEIKRFLSSFDKESVKHCVIEDVHSVFGAGAGSNFQFGRALGIIEMAVAMLDFPFTKVTPKKWQKEMWEGIRPVSTTVTKYKTDKKTGQKIPVGVKEKIDTKVTSALACKRLFPNVDLRDTDRKTERSKKDHDGIIDALLMAEYCRRKFK